MSKFQLCTTLGAQKNAEKPKSKKLQTLDGRLPPEVGSDWLETWPKRVSDDSRHFVLRRRKTKKCLKKSTSKFFCFKNCPFWRSYTVLGVTGRFSMKNDPRGPGFQPSTTLGGGVKSGKTKIFRTFCQKSISQKSWFTI